MTETSKLQRAAGYLNASEYDDLRWVYRDSGTCRYYIVYEGDLESLCDYLDDEDESVSGDAYSHWCAGTIATEMPADWTSDAN